MLSRTFSSCFIYPPLSISFSWLQTIDLLASNWISRSFSALSEERFDFIVCKALRGLMIGGLHEKFFRKGLLDAFFGLIGIKKCPFECSEEIYSRMSEL